MQLTFCGAAGQVTGSCYLFTTRGARFLVDCGLFQGNHATRQLNLARRPYDARSIDFVLLSHAHLDHSGLLPRLVAEGFRGPIYTTAATRDLLAVMLPDSAHLQQVEAERAERLGRDFRAVYSLQDARDTLRQIRVVRYEETFSPARGIDACLLEAGHILGSAIVTLTVSDQGHRTRVVCSGDLGQPGRPIVRDPAVVTDADVLLLESTYGNRNHRSLGETLDELVAALRRALDERHGIVLVPAFAVGRTQEFLYYLRQLRREGRIPPVHVFVDSPMATEVTEITARHLELFDEEARQLARSPTTSGDGLSLAFTGDVQESMALNRLESGTIIVAASGMCDGGRIRHHLRQRLSNPRTTVLIVGFQAAGTLGRRLVDRAPSVRIMGQDVPVRAEIVTLGGFSAHADQRALLDWLRHFRRTPREVFLVHGEPENAAALAAAMRAQLGWATRIPAHGESVVLTCDDR